MENFITKQKCRLLKRAIDQRSASKSLFLKKPLETHNDKTEDSYQSYLPLILREVVTF